MDLKNMTLTDVLSLQTFCPTALCLWIFVLPDILPAGRFDPPDVLSCQTFVPPAFLAPYAHFLAPVSLAASTLVRYKLCDLT